MHKNKKSMVDMMIANTSEANLKHYRIYKVEIFHMSKIFRSENEICQKNEKKIFQKNKKKICQENELEEYEQSSTEESSDSSQDYSNLPDSNVAILDVPVFHDMKHLVSSIQLLQEPKREPDADSSDVYDNIQVPMDLCIMA